MKFRLFIAAILPLLYALSAMAQGIDEVGQWRSVGLDKSFGKRWKLEAELEYRAQNKTRFSAGLGADFKVNKHLKLGAGYTFLLNPKLKPERFTDKNEFSAWPGCLPEECPSEFTNGYNYFKAYRLPPRHRAFVDVTGTVKLWKWFRISLRERVQYTWRKAYSTDKLSHREVYAKQYDFDFDENWNIIDIWSIRQESVRDVWSLKTYDPSCDRVLRSRIKLEVDKKSWNLSPFISAEAHNSITHGEKMLLQKVRTAIGTSYKFRKHNKIQLAYILTVGMYDVEDGVVEREDERMHTMSLGYSYSF